MIVRDMLKHTHTQTHIFTSFSGCTTNLTEGKTCKWKYFLFSLHFMFRSHILLLHFPAFKCSFSIYLCLWAHFAGLNLFCVADVRTHSFAQFLVMYLVVFLLFCYSVVVGLMNVCPLLVPLQFQTQCNHIKASKWQQK